MFFIDWRNASPSGVLQKAACIIGPGVVVDPFVFLEEIKQLEDRQTLVKIVNEWRVLDDSVTSCISRDTVRKAHSYPFTVYHELNDSIHIELCRMAMQLQLLM